MRRAALCAAASLGVLTALPSPAHAQYKIGNEQSFVTVGGLLQPWMALNGMEAPNGGTQSDFYVRRMRLMLGGQVTPLVNFFLSTDAPNFGKAGNYEVNMYMQDAFVELNVHKALQVDAGMLLAPFSHHGMQAAGSLMAVDYHADMMRTPPTSNKVWRSAGVLVRGLLVKEFIEYRLAVLNGVAGNGKLVSRNVAGKNGGAATTWQEQTDPRNRSDVPLVVARLVLNAFESEAGPGAAGFFYDGLYLKKTPAGTISPKRVLSLGGSFAYQKGLNVTESEVAAGSTGTVRSVAATKDYYAAALDLFWDLPVGADKLMSLNGQVNFFYYQAGDRRDVNAFYNRPELATAARLAYTGYGVASELGYRVDFIEPFVVVDWFKSTRANQDLGDYLAVYGGVAVYLNGHAASIKAQTGTVKADGKEAKGSGVVQLQLQF